MEGVKKNMKQPSRKYLILAGVFFLLFATLTAVVSLVDVRPIGPRGSEVGLAALNEAVFTHIGAHPLWDTVTDGLMVLALLTALGFALLGAVQLVRRRSLWRVDRQILLLGVLYVLVALVYVLFELVIVNYRPVLQNGELEASYPSSHTMIVLCIMATAVVALWDMLADKKVLRMVVNAVATAVMAVMVIGRLLSGQHWATDILGGLLLSAALTMLYRSAVVRTAPKDPEG